MSKYLKHMVSGPDPKSVTVEFGGGKYTVESLGGRQYRILRADREFVTMLGVWHEVSIFSPDKPPARVLDHTAIVLDEIARVAFPEPLEGGQNE